eukprot:3382334-Rhodomonas_salina.5
MPAYLLHDRFCALLKGLFKLYLVAQVPVGDQYLTTRVQAEVPAQAHTGQLAVQACVPERTYAPIAG